LNDTIPNSKAQQDADRLEVAGGLSAFAGGYYGGAGWDEGMCAYWFLVWLVFCGALGCLMLEVFFGRKIGWVLYMGLVEARRLKVSYGWSMIAFV
jgi:hypothetical protein